MLRSMISFDPIRGEVAWSSIITLLFAGSMAWGLFCYYVLASPLVIAAVHAGLFAVAWYLSTCIPDFKEIKQSHKNATAYRKPQWQSKEWVLPDAVAFHALVDKPSHAHTEAEHQQTKGTHSGRTTRGGGEPILTGVASGRQIYSYRDSSASSSVSSSSSTSSSKTPSFNPSQNPNSADKLFRQQMVDAYIRKHGGLPKQLLAEKKRSTSAAATAKEAAVRGAAFYEMLQVRVIPTPVLVHAYMRTKVHVHVYTTTCVVSYVCRRRMGTGRVTTAAPCFSSPAW